MQSHRRVTIQFPDAPPGTCRFCGRRCMPRRRGHDDCAVAYRESIGHRAAMIERRGGDEKAVLCVDRFQSRCSGPIQSDHVRELADYGDPAWTVPRCKTHHDEKSKRSAAARRERKAGSMGKGNSGGGGDDWEVLVWLLLAAGALAALQASGFLGRMKDKALGAVTGLGGSLPDVGTAAIPRPDGINPWPFIIAIAAIAGVVVWRKARAAALARLTEALARATYTDPSEITVRIGLTTARGSCHYTPAFNDSPGSADRSRVEDVLTRKVGRDIGVRWTPHRDTVKWSPRWVEDHPVEDLAAADVVEQPQQDHDVVTRIREGLIHLIPKDAALTVRATQSDSVGPAVIRVDYPASVRDDAADTRAAWQDKIGAKVPEHRWRPCWDTGANILTLVRRPPMPARVDLVEPGDCSDTFRLPIGVDEHSDPVFWNMTVNPHSLIAGATGSGKTVALSRIIIEAAARGFDLVLVDGKGSALAGFRQWPGVVKYGMAEGRDMNEALVWAEGEMRRRYRLVTDEGVDPKTFRPILVIADEFTEVMGLMKRWWTKEGALENGEENDRGKMIKSPMKEPPGVDSWSSIARLGREARVHIVVGIQQAAASIFGSTESRDQLGFRVVCGPTTPQSATMVFGRSDVGRDVPDDAKGRATIQPRPGGDGVEVQVYWTPSPRPHGAPPDDKADAEMLRRYRDACPRAVAGAGLPPSGSLSGAVVSGYIEDGATETVYVSRHSAVAVEDPPEPVTPGTVPTGRWMTRRAEALNEGDYVRHDGVVARVTGDVDYDDDGDVLIPVHILKVQGGASSVGDEEDWGMDPVEQVEVLRY